LDGTLAERDWHNCRRYLRANGNGKDIYDG